MPESCSIRNLQRAWQPTRGRPLSQPPAKLTNMNPLHAEEQKRLVAQWRETGFALEKLRYAALASQSPAESRQAAYDMLQLGGILDGESRDTFGAGLVEMQRLFGALRAHGRG